MQSRLSTCYELSYGTSSTKVDWVRAENGSCGKKTDTYRHFSNLYTDDIDLESILNYSFQTTITMRYANGRHRAVNLSPTVKALHNV